MIDEARFEAFFRSMEELRESQARTDAQLAKTDAQLQRTDAQLAKTDAQLQRTDAQLAKTDAQLQRTDAQLAKTIAKLDKVGVLLGNIGNNQGAVAEEFFFNSLKASQELAGINYDFIDHNVVRSSRGISDEFDILLVNGKDVAIVEVKYRANAKDLEKLLTKKYENFKKLYPMYKDFNHHLALASFKFDEELKEEALGKNVIVLQRKGKVVETFLPRVA